MPRRRADLSRLHVVVPVRSLSGGKLRLGGALDPEERQTLVAGMLLHVLDVLAAWGRSAATWLVSGDPAALALGRRAGVKALVPPESGLNAGLRSSVAHARGEGATAVLVLPADLPLVTVAALERLADAADAALVAGSARPLVVVVPSDARNGTNALLLSPVDAIPPCFGPNSLERHLRSAAGAGATIQVCVDSEIGFDLDDPEDVEQLDAGRLEELEERAQRVWEAFAADTSRA